MQTEIKGFYNFYEGPKFIFVSKGQYKPYLEYELKEDYMIGSMIVSSKRVGYLNGAVVEKLVDYKRDLLNRRLSEPNGVISIREMINWVEESL